MTEYRWMRPPLWDVSRFWDAVGAAVALGQMLESAEEQRAFYALEALTEAFGGLPPGH